MATRSRKSKGGLLGGVFSFFIIGACIVGFFGIPSDPNIEDIPDMFRSKSLTVEAWMQNCVPNAVKLDFSQCSLASNVQQGTDIPAPAPPVTGIPAAETVAQLDALSIADAQSVSYDRDEWNHWISQGASCWDTRDQVLYDEAVKDASLILKNNAGDTVTDVSSACSVNAGTWNDPYSGSVITNPRDLDVDHMIPLSYAAQHGGQSWDKAKKQAYANDLSNAGHLIAVTASENRSKSDRGPSEWKPTNKAGYCVYATDWITVSKNYGLSIAQEDVTALKDMLATCV